MRRTLAIAALALFTSTARADDGLPLPTKKEAAPAKPPAASADELRWGRNVAYGDGRDSVVVEKVSRTFDPSVRTWKIVAGIGIDGRRDLPGSGVRTPRSVSASGARAAFGKATVERLTFPSVETADLFAAHQLDLSNGPVFVEQRGAELVIVHDPALRDDTRLIEAYRAAAWDVLPWSGALQSMALYDAERGERVARAFGSEGRDGVREAIRLAYEALKKSPDIDFGGLTQYSASVNLRSGVSATATVIPGGESSLSYTRRSDRAFVLWRLEEELRHGDPLPRASAPWTRGITSALDRLRGK